MASAVQDIPHGLRYPMEMFLSTAIPKPPAFEENTPEYRLHELFTAKTIVRVLDGWHYKTFGELPGKFVSAYNSLNRREVVWITEDNIVQFQTEEEYEANLAERDRIEAKLAVSREHEPARAA